MGNINGKKVLQVVRTVEAGGSKGNSIWITNVAPVYNVSDVRYELQASNIIPQQSATKEMTVGDVVVYIDNTTNANNPVAKEMYMIDVIPDDLVGYSLQLSKKSNFGLSSSGLYSTTETLSTTVGNTTQVALTDITNNGNEIKLGDYIINETQGVLGYVSVLNPTNATVTTKLIMGGKQLYRHNINIRGLYFSFIDNTNTLYTNASDIKSKLTSLGHTSKTKALQCSGQYTADGTVYYNVVAVFVDSTSYMYGWTIVCANLTTPAVQLETIYWNSDSMYGVTGIDTVNAL